MQNKKMTETNNYHIPVLFNEVIENLAIKPDGVYVDCTFGGGGHSKGILEKLSENGRLIAFDQDEDALQNVPQHEERIIFIPQNFRYIKRFLRVNGIDKVDGILADLGVSSHQFDKGERGFSTRFDGPLDMRMDMRGEVTARDVLLNLNEKELQELFSKYGEVTNAKTLAKHIVDNRTPAVLQTINEFKNLIAPVVKGNPNKYFAQVFQALRIEVNEEMKALEELLEQIPDVLNSGGRAAVITFHSLEDRMVKTFFKQGRWSVEEENPLINSSFVNPLRVITKKPLIPAAEEIKRNSRSRSSKLRVAEKI